MSAADRAGPVLDHVQVAAPPGCEPDARRFYGELLRLREIEKPETLRGQGVPTRGGTAWSCSP